MAAKGQYISCAQYQSYLHNQTPIYDKEILRDVRPTTGDLMGYYRSGVWPAFSGASHTFDRYHGVHPDTTKPWNTVTDTACGGRPCDPEENTIGWGWSRETYGRETQSWGSDILCFDQMMLKTHAKEHFRHIVDKILRPATTWIMSAYLMRKAAELAGRKIAVASGLPEFTFQWDPGGYVFMTSSVEPTGRLTPEILRRQVRRHYMNGAIDRSEKGYQSLELHTDEDTFSYLAREHPTLKELWRFGAFNAANEMYWKYGFSGYVGDFMVKCLQFPIRFNKISATRYQQVLPFKNVATDEGIKQEFNADYDRAQYQFSLINNKRGLKVLPFRAEAVHPDMPFLVRDYGGKWQFVTNDLGADRNGRAIDNSRKNKGKFIADFDLAVRPDFPEYIDLFFHIVDKDAVTIIGPSNTYPGYPDQSYLMNNSVCACAAEMGLTAIANQTGVYSIAANTILVNGAAITHGAISQATVAGLVTALGTAWTAASLEGTWSVVSAGDRTIKIAWSGAQIAQNSIEIPFLVT